MKFLRACLIGATLLSTVSPMNATAAEPTGRVLEFNVGSRRVEPRRAQMQPGDTIRATFTERLWISCNGGGQQCFSGLKNPGEVFEFVATSAAFSFGVILEWSSYGDYECTGTCATLLDLGYPTPDPVDPLPGGLYTTSRAGELPETALVTFTFVRPANWYGFSFRDVNRNGTTFQVYPDAPGFSEPGSTISRTLSLRNGYNRFRVWFSHGNTDDGTETVSYPIDIDFIVDGPDVSPPRVLLSPPTRLAGQTVQAGTLLVAGGSPVSVSGAVADDGVIVSIRAQLRSVATGAITWITLRCSAPETQEIIPCEPTQSAPYGPALGRVIVSGQVAASGAHWLAVTGTDLAGRTGTYQRLLVTV